MENRAYALAAGTFVVVLGVMLLAVAVWLAGGRSQGLPYDLITRRSVAGLAQGAPVRLHGVEVGHVESVQFDPQDRRRVRVRARISPNALLMEGAWARLSSLGISGSPYIELGYPEHAATVLHTSEISPTRIPLNPSGLAQLSDSSDELLRSIGGTLARLNTILTPENATRVSRLLDESNAAVARIRTIGEALTPAARRATRLVAHSDQTVRDADALLVEVRSKTAALDAVREGGLATVELEQRLQRETLPDISELAQRLTRNSDTLEQVLRELRDRPQSVLFGPAPGAPGPGEPGFRPPRP